MANKNPRQTEEFKEYFIKPIGTNQKMGTKVFGVRVPMDTQDKLLEMPQTQRVKLIRDAIIKAVKSETN